MSLFSMDGKFLEYFNKITDLIILNVLWLLCCIPIVTIGAATSALYQISLQMAENRESYIARSFFQAFRENFKQVTQIWLISLGVGLILFCDLYIVSHFFKAPVLLSFLLMLCLILFSGFLYFFPVIAYFRNSTKKLLENSFRLAIGHPGTTLQLFLLSFLPTLVLVLFQKNLILGSFLFIIGLPSLTVFLKSCLLSKLFKTIKVVKE